MPPRENWHLDKKVPIGIIVALFLQTIVIVSVGTDMLSNLDNRITNLEKSDSGQANHENRLVILEQGLTYIRDDLAEIKTLLRRRVPGEIEQNQQ